MPGTQLNWLFDSLLPASILSHCVQVKKEKKRGKKNPRQISAEASLAPAHDSLICTPE